jgi:hypothetical protein
MNTQCIPCDKLKALLGNFQEILIFEISLETAAIHSAADDLSGMDWE